MGGVSFSSILSREIKVGQIIVASVQIIDSIGQIVIKSEQVNGLAAQKS